VAGLGGRGAMYVLTDSKKMAKIFAFVNRWQMIKIPS
jgi:hypothetical protein